MPATSLKADLLSMTPDAEALVYSAARQCYSADDAADIYLRARMADDCAIFEGEPLPITEEEQQKLICRVIDSGHDSVAEHVSFSFAISGISRALSHQLVRHRIASYSQQSQRYVKADDFDYIIPPHIAAVPEIAEVYKRHMEKSNITYGVIKDMLTLRGHGEKAAEDARYVLPNAAETKIVVTMNCRALLHFFELRVCTRAQWEIRAMANAMLAICKEKLPVVFSGRGARCEALGYCPEDKSCGRKPKLEK